MNSMIPLVLPYVLVAIVIVLSLALFIMVKADVRRCAARWAKEREQMQQQQQELLAQISALEGALRERSPAAPAAPIGVRPALNLQRRAQILRLAKQGEEPGQIAAELAVPRKEVELLLKLQAAQQRSASA
jgi:flagellar biosynthesis/type III secretory pathway M-ring protein FliF/YscJ